MRDNARHWRTCLQTRSPHPGANMLTRRAWFGSDAYQQKTCWYLAPKACQHGKAGHQSSSNPEMKKDFRG